MFPVVVYEEGVELPNTGTYYVIAENGNWLHKDTGIVHGFIPVDTVPVLQSLQQGAVIGCRLPKIPALHVHRIKEFFRRVVDKHHSEASTTLYFNPKVQKYKIVIPEQEVSHGGVNYDRKGLSHVKGFEDWLRVGTIHSHCDFGAYHSGTDIGDEKDFDGIHLTFGHNNKDIFTISCSIVVNGFRAKCDPQRFIQGVEPLSDFKAENTRYISSEQRFRLVKVPKETQEKWYNGIDEKWMTKVKPKSFSWFGSNNATTVTYVDSDKITSGDSVRFKDDPRVSIYKKLIGYGPYQVARAAQSEPTIVIYTKLGKARFSKELFEKSHRWVQQSYGHQKKVETKPTQTQQVSKPQDGRDYYGHPDLEGGDILSGLFGTKKKD